MWSTSILYSQTLSICQGDHKDKTKRKIQKSCKISDVPGLLIDRENLNLFKTNSQFQLIWHDWGLSKIYRSSVQTECWVYLLVLVSSGSISGVDEPLDWDLVCAVCFLGVESNLTCNLIYLTVVRILKNILQTPSFHHIIKVDCGN